MAKFLSTPALIEALQTLIDRSQKHLVLVTDVVRLNEHLRELLAQKSKMQVAIRIVCGDKSLSPDDHQWFKKHPAVQLRHVPHLHAKCYINDNMAIITSLGLDDMERSHTTEMGVLATLDDDPDLYKNAIKEVGRILREGDHIISKQELVSDYAEEKELLTIPQIAHEQGLSSAEVIAKLLNKGYLTEYEGMFILTNAGKNIGARLITSSHGVSFFWPPEVLQE